MELIRRRTGIEKKRKGAADGGGQGPAVQTRQPDPFAVKSVEIVERRFCWDRKPIAPVYGRYGGGRRWDGVFACMREARDKEIIISLAPCRAVRWIKPKTEEGKSWMLFVEVLADGAGINVNDAASAKSEGG